MACSTSWKVKTDMERKPNILIVHNHYRISGGEDTVVANEKKLLEDNGHKVILYKRNNSEIDSFNLVQKLALPFASIFNIKTYRDIRRLIKNEDIDIVHVHNTMTLISPAVYYAAFTEKKPVVQTVHNFRLICPGALLYRDGHVCEECINGGLKYSLKYNCYRNSRMQTLISVLILHIHRKLGTYRRLNYICLTEFNKHKLLEGKGSRYFDENKMYIKPNFAVGTAKTVPFNDRKKQFVYVGRPEKVKGIDILLEAWRHIDGYGLVICGTSDEMDRIRKYISDNHLDNVSLLGRVDNSVVKEILADSWGMILPTQWYEGFPMTIAESYSVGTPVLGSNVGNTADLIRNGETGYIFRHDSWEALADKVTMVADMTESCRKYYESDFNPKANYNILQDIYNDLKI
jgi:glycosyltransferase involved in cell wall biosynthesis